jgi:hypothetical protein
MNVWEKHWAFKIVTQHLRDTLRPSTPEYQHEYYLRHKSEIQEYQREYRIKNGERLRARQKELRKLRCRHPAAFSRRQHHQSYLLMDST